MIGEFHRIAQQIHQHLSEPRHIAHDGHWHIGLDKVQQFDTFVADTGSNEVEGFLDAVDELEGEAFDIHFS